MEIINYSFPIFIKDLIISNKYIDLVKNLNLTKYEFNENNFFKNKKNSKFIKNTDNEISLFLLEIKKILNLNNYHFNDIWVQKYSNNDFHDCHIHNPNSFSFIIYIDCADSSSETMFYNVGYPYFFIKSYKIKPKIGRCIVFHGAIPHTALPNKDNKRLIVSGNLTFN
jgi:hypothetical protein